MTMELRLLKIVTEVDGAINSDEPIRVEDVRVKEPR